MRQVVRCLVTALVVVVLTGPALAQRPSSANGGATAAAPSLLNLNTASVTQLEKLPGIGPKTAQSIIEHRQKNGGFKKIEELMNVRGIGEKSFLKLKPLITVTPVKTEAGDQAAQR